MASMRIYPYLQGKTWVFDDASNGLKAEAFVLGFSEAITSLVEFKRIPNAAQGFELIFSDKTFDDYDVEMNWIRSDEPDTPMPGNWYRGLLRGVLLEGWLCPALLLYFPAAPKKLFVQGEPLPTGVDPIWHVDEDDPSQHRFMSADEV
jgi:hypothetical protein